MSSRPKLDHLTANPCLPPCTPIYPPCCPLPLVVPPPVLALTPRSYAWAIFGITWRLPGTQHWAILNSGCTAHYLSAGCPFPIDSLAPRQCVGLPTGAGMHSSGSCDLPTVYYIHMQNIAVTTLCLYSS